MRFQFKEILERLVEFREELNDLIDYIELLEALGHNLNKQRHDTMEVKEILGL